MIRNINALEDFLGEEVVDREGNLVGTLACYWERRPKEALLLGVDIPDKSGHTHIVPAFGARCNERQIYVEVAFTRDKIAQSPPVTCEGEVDGKLEERIWAYYGMQTTRPGTLPSESTKEGVTDPLQRIASQTTGPVAVDDVTPPKPHEDGPKAQESKTPGSSVE